ncbi:hypothetical protein FQR65_LT04748 [Abscondita terminalis]|nr:hypothetical protein FQR65_LT04748 [Abscondita terminalis]
MRLEAAISWNQQLLPSRSGMCTGKKSGVAEEINQAVESGSNIQVIDIETANIGEKSTECDINKNLDVADIEIHDYKTNQLKKNTKEADEYVASNHCGCIRSDDNDDDPVSDREEIEDSELECFDCEMGENDRDEDDLNQNLHLFLSHYHLCTI